jgi:hypothetical protein
MAGACSAFATGIAQLASFCQAPIVRGKIRIEQAHEGLILRRAELNQLTVMC